MEWSAKEKMEYSKEERFPIISHTEKVPLQIVLVTPAIPVKAVVQFFHGGEETKEDYLSFMEFLASHGFASIAYDYRGHGESVRAKKELGYYHRYGAKALVEDANLVNRYVRRRFREVPIYLYGHDMGSLLVRAYLKHHDRVVDGVILSGMLPKNPYSSSLVRISRLASKLRGDQEIPLYMRRFSNGYVKEDATYNVYETRFRLLHWAYEEHNWSVNQPSLPILVLQGKEESRELVEAATKSIDVLCKVGYRNVTLQTYKGMGRELLQEKDYIKVWFDVATKLELWLDRK